MTLVLLHPVGLDGQSFQFLDEDLLDSAVSYDLLWHGRRTEPEAAPTLESYADDVVAHVEGPLDIAGVSLGGSVAQYIALRHPDRVRSLVLAASTAGDGSPERLLDQESRAKLTVEGGMAAMCDWTLPRWFTEPAIARTPTHPAIAYTRRRLLGDDPRAVAAAWLSLGRADSLRRLGEIAAPTTVLHPDKDVSPLAAKQALADGIPNSRLVVVGGPHMVHLEEPAVFSQALRDHLAWVDSGAPRA